MFLEDQRLVISTYLDRSPVLLDPLTELLSMYISYRPLIKLHFKYKKKGIERFLTESQNFKL